MRYASWFLLESRPISRRYSSRSVYLRIAHWFSEAKCPLCIRLTTPDAAANKDPMASEISHSTEPPSKIATIPANFSALPKSWRIQMACSALSQPRLSNKIRPSWLSIFAPSPKAQVACEIFPKTAGTCGIELAMPEPPEITKAPPCTAVSAANFRCPFFQPLCAETMPKMPERVNKNPPVTPKPRLNRASRPGALRATTSPEESIPMKLLSSPNIFPLGLNHRWSRCSPSLGATDADDNRVLDRGTATKERLERLAKDIGGRLIVDARDRRA